MKKIGYIVLCIITLVIAFFISFAITNRLLNTSNINHIEESNAVDNTETEETKKDVNINENSKNNFFEGIIISIEGTNVGVENPSHLVDYSIYEGDMKWHDKHKIVVDGKLCVTASYLLCLDNVPIKDNNGNEINILDLKIGDTINVFTKNIRYTESTISTPITSDYIELIEKVKAN